ncbi:hypothetical protein [Gluconobacter oxydans]|uniref:hypothetical protein n=1 Tax=Gluconobacter oxydans TaxID=442 RepID=UPI0039ED5F2B
MIFGKKALLLSEINEVERILSQTPIENVIDIYGLQNRLDELKAHLAILPDRIAEAEKLSLTFRGEPVRGSNAISADFAGKASAAFVDAFTSILAGLKGSLQFSGPIPDKVNMPLMITGTATGSFGFEMELPGEQEDIFDRTASSGGAMEMFKSLLRLSAEGSDDEITDIVEEIHPRAVRKVADFLSTVSRGGAWCGLEFRNNYFKFDSLEQIRLSEERLKQENIIERKEVFFGEFLGFLPKSRNFEFLVADSSETIRGRFGIDVENSQNLNSEFLSRRVRVQFDVIQVGQGKPRYTLSSTKDITIQ